MAATWGLTGGNPCLMGLRVPREGSEPEVTWREPCSDPRRPPSAKAEHQGGYHGHGE